MLEPPIDSFVCFEPAHLDAELFKELLVGSFMMMVMMP